MKQTIQIKVRANLLWKYGMTPQGNYVAVCDAIAQTVQAEKFYELLEMMQEALDSTFRELLSTGDLDKFLHARGWRLASPPVARRATRNVEFDVPFNVRRLNARILQEAVC